MIEEKLMSNKINERSNFELDDVRKIEKKENSQKRIYNQIIELINARKSIIFGPEKNKTAKFIAKNYVDVLNILNKYNKIKSD